MSADNHTPDIDPHSGVPTTGHEWDGIKELNNPAPRWWLWVFFLCCLWAFGYWFVYPTWPTVSGNGVRGGTEGSFGWTSHNQLADHQREIMTRKQRYLDRFQRASFEEIMGDPQLYAFGIAGGKTSFKDNCATCHGTGGAGGKGYPNLNDDEWLWGGSADAIYQTIAHGVRFEENEETRFSQMPAYADILEKQDMEDVTLHVLSLAGNGASSANGALVYDDHCASCHGETGQGIRSLGAPSLSDSIWLYGDDSKSAIIAQIKAPRHGIMPAWNHRLSDDTIRQLTLYVHSLGGGE